MPFISVYRDIGATVIRRRVRLRLRISAVSASLHRKLSHANGVRTITRAVTSLFNRDITVFSNSNLLTTQTNHTFSTNGRSDTIVTLRDHSQPIKTLRVARHAVAFSTAVHQTVTAVISPITTLCVSNNTHVNVVRRLDVNPTSNIRIGAFRTRRTRTVLRTLNFTKSYVCVPFTFQFESIIRNVGRMSAVIRQFRRQSKYTISYVLRNSLVIK